MICVDIDDFIELIILILKCVYLEFEMLYFLWIINCINLKIFKDILVYRECKIWNKLIKWRIIK